jgi:hypothetical protein
MNFDFYRSLRYQPYNLTPYISYKSRYSPYDNYLRQGEREVHIGAHRYALQKGYLTGIPTYDDAIIQGVGNVYGIALIRKDKGTLEDVASSILGNPEPKNLHNAVHRYAISKGYLTGVPTYVETFETGVGRVHGVALIRKEAGTLEDVTPSELGNPNPNDVRNFHTAVHRYALNKGYLTGFPTYHDALIQGVGNVYGIALIKKDAGILENVETSEITGDKKVIGCISGLFGHADILGSTGMRNLRDHLRTHLSDLIRPENIFYESWNPGAEDNPFDPPAIDILNSRIQQIARNPSYLALIGFSYGGWAVSRLSRITTRTPDFIGLIDSGFGPANRITNIDVPRGRVIKNWFQNYAIQDPEPCTGYLRVPCIVRDCGNQNVPGAENIHEEFLKNYEGNRERKACPFIGRKPIRSTHANIAGNHWIWRQITDKIRSDISTL